MRRGSRARARTRRSSSAAGARHSTKTSRAAADPERGPEHVAERAAMERRVDDDRAGLGGRASGRAPGRWRRSRPRRRRSRARGRRARGRRRPLRTTSELSAGRPARSASDPASVLLPLAATPAIAITPARGPPRAAASRVAAGRPRARARRRGRRIRRELAGPEQRDLRADARAVGGEERDQAVVPRVATGVPVAVHERLGEVRRSGGVEIHDQERQVEPDVDAPQSRVELDRVDERPIRVEQDVLGAEVSMAVPDAALACAGVELRPARPQEAGRAALRRDELARRAARRRPAASTARRSRRRASA